MTSNINRLRTALKKNWMRQEQEQWIYGKLGRVREGLDPEYEVKGRKNFLYVTIRNASGAQTAVPARNDVGVPYTEPIQVKIKQEYGVYVIGGRTGKADEGSTPVAPPSGVFPHTFISHTDVPSNYTGDSLKIVRVNVGETGLEFVTESAGAVDSVNGQTGVVVLDADDIDDTATTNKFTTAAEASKLAGIEALADVTDAGNVSPVITAFAAKNPPIDADSVVITDSAAADVPKRVTFTNIKAFLKTYFDTLYATAATVASAIATHAGLTTTHGVSGTIVGTSDAQTLTNKTLDSTNISTLTAKNPPIDADSAVIVDSADSNKVKRVTYTNIKAFLKTYFDTLYGLIAGNNSWSGLNEFINSTFPPLRAIRTSAETVQVRSATSSMHRTSGNMADGFGAAYTFEINDSGVSGTNIIATVNALRDGADNSGKVVIEPYAAGVAVSVMYVTKEGRIGILQSTPADTLAISQTQLTGKALSVLRDLASGSTDSPLVTFINENASDDQTALYVRNDGSGVVFHAVGDRNGSVGLSFENINAGANSHTRVWIDVPNGGGDPHILFSLVAGGGKVYDMGIDNSDSDKFKISEGVNLGTNDRFVLDGINVGFGVSSPQGKMHEYAGFSGKMFCEKAAISNVKVVIIADGTGDVTRYVMGRLLLHSAGTSVVNNILCANGASMAGMNCGAGTYTVTVSAGGELSIIRSAGSGTADATFDLNWQ